jgi:hypothetical protein
MQEIADIVSTKREHWHTAYNDGYNNITLEERKAYESQMHTRLIGLGITLALI